MQLGSEEVSIAKEMEFFVHKSCREHGHKTWDRSGEKCGVDWIGRKQGSRSWSLVLMFIESRIPGFGQHNRI